jgi:hypothetical protein
MKQTAEEIIGTYSDAIPNELIEAINTGSCIALIGSGISSRCLSKSRTPLPLWKNLLLSIINFALEHNLIEPNINDELKYLLDEQKFLVVAQELYEVLGENKINDYIINVFNPEDIVPSILHEIIAITPFSQIMTTNYDNLLERAYIETNKHHIDVLLFQDIIDSDKFQNQKSIIKLHGDIKKPDSFILGHQHYQNLLKDQKYCTFVDELFENNSIFMLGYGLSDIDIQMTLDRISGKNKRTHFLLSKKGTYSNIERQRLLKDRNVKVIEYIDYFGFHNHIDTFLKGLNVAIGNREKLQKLPRQEIRARISVHYPEETQKDGQFIKNFIFREGAITLANNSMEAQVQHLDDYLMQGFRALDYLLFVVKEEHFNEKNLFFTKMNLSLDKCSSQGVHVIFILIGAEKRPTFLQKRTLAPTFYIKNDFSEKDLLLLRSYISQDIKMGFR